MTRLGSSTSIDAFGQDQVLGLGVLADVERADVERELVRDLGRQALDLDLAGDEVEHAALVLDAVGHADDLDLDPHRHPLDQVDALEVDVQDAAVDGIDLQLADHGVVIVGAGMRSRKIEFSVAPSRSMVTIERRSSCTFCGGRSSAVDDARHLAGGAQAAVGVLAAIGPRLYFEGELLGHLVSLSFVSGGRFMDGSRRARVRRRAR